MKFCIGFYALAIALLLSSFIEAVAQQEPQPNTPSPVHRALNPPTSLDTRLVRVPFGSEIYEIPQNYLRGVIQPKTLGGYAAFSIEILLPELKPREPGNIDRFNIVGFGDRLIATVEYDVNFDPAEIVINRLLETSHTDKEIFTTTDSGYKLFRIKSRVPFPELYVKYTEGKIFYFDCLTEHEVPYPACTVQENFERNRRITYSFNRKYIESALENDSKLHSLIDSFLSIK